MTEQAKPAEERKAKVVGEVRIIVWDSGDIDVEGNAILHNKMTMYGILGCLYEMVMRGNFLKPTDQKKSGIIVPPPGGFNPGLLRRKP